MLNGMIGKFTGKLVWETFGHVLRVTIFHNKKVNKGGRMCELKRKGNSNIYELPDELRGGFNDGGKGLVAGHYFIRETATHESYKKTFPDKHFEIKASLLGDDKTYRDGALYPIFENGAGAENEPKKAGIRLHKVDTEKHEDGRGGEPQGNGRLDAEFAVVNIAVLHGELLPGLHELDGNLLRPSLRLFPAFNPADMAIKPYLPTSCGDKFRLPIWCHVISTSLALSARLQAK